jgi:hypothetical protein
MKHAIYILSLCLVVGASAPKALGHRYHTSVTRLEYNAEERLVEITVRTFADDLEAIVSTRAGKIARLDGSQAADTLLFAYLRSVFQLKSGVQKVELQWIGMELKGNTALIYLQARMPEDRSKTSLQNTLLFDLFEDQINIVNVLDKGKKASLVFKRGEGPQEIP